MYLPFHNIFVTFMLQLMDNGHVMRPFIKNIPNNWPFGGDGPNKLLDIWGISSSLCVPSP